MCDREKDRGCQGRVLWGVLPISSEGETCVNRTYTVHVNPSGLKQNPRKSLEPMKIKPKKIPC